MRGHIQERGGKWRVTVDVGRDPITGKRRRLGGTCGTEGEAERLAARIIADHDGKAPSAKGHTVGDALEAWWDFKRASLAPATRKGYRSRLDGHLIPEFGAVKLDKLTARKIDTVWAFMAGRGLSPRTIRQSHVVLSMALGQAVKWGWLRENPAERATPPRVPKASEERAERGVPSVEDVEAVLGELDGAARDTATLAIATGRRLGELCAIRWADVDLDAGTVTMRATITETGGGAWEHVTAGRKSKTATVALNDTAVGLLKRRRREAAEVALAFGIGKLDQAAYVLAEEPGGLVPLLPSAVSSRWRYAARRAGVAVRFHDLRHLFVSRAIRAGIDLATIAHTVGHASTQVTSTVYAHVIEEQGVDRRATEVMGALFG
jgi:integrase